MKELSGGHAWGGFGRRSNWSVWLITFFTHSPCLGPRLLAGQHPAALQIGLLPANKAHNCSQCVRDNEVYCQGEDSVVELQGREGM